MYKIRGPFLVIAPLSTIPHWKREFENWTDMNAIVYHGNAESRALLRTYEVCRAKMINYGEGLWLDLQSKFSNNVNNVHIKIRSLQTNSS